MQLLMIIFGALAAYIFQKMFRKGRAMTLVLAAAIYVGFAVTQQNIGVTLLSMAGFLGFSGLALMGGRVNFWWLVAGWGLHGVWDVALHFTKPNFFAPTWYAFACLGFDLTLAAFILHDGLNPPKYMKR